MTNRSLLAGILAVSALFTANHASGRESFNNGWRFSLLSDADTTRFESPSFNDASWRTLSLPHDWAIEGTFSKDNPSGVDGGALPGGTGWYRKHFATPAVMADGDRVFVDFDGSYMNSSVYVNGTLVGTRPYGYASFSYDITPLLRRDGGENVIAVKVDNSLQPNSRWYSGCGIFRNTWIRHERGVFIPLWGQHVVSKVNAGNVGQVTVTTDIENTTSRNSNVTVDTRIVAPDGKCVSSRSSKVRVKAGQSSECALTLDVADPHLWSPASPALYRVETTLTVDGRVTDTNMIRTGFRTLAFDHETGFYVNGKPTKLNGVCLHHDMGALGAAVNRRAVERQMQIMKEMGVNAVRTSHNPPSPELLDVCDSIGLLVMDEAFDMWRHQKTAHDYGQYFEEWYERDLSDFVRRDRNHPSVFMWSVGNEIIEQWNNVTTDTLSVEEANLILNLGQKADAVADTSLTVSMLLTRRLADIIHRYDTTRPITAGCNNPEPSNNLLRSGALDVVGYNYHHWWYDTIPAIWPGKPMVVAESVSGLMTRGYYRMPSDTVFVWPDRWDGKFGDPSFSCSSYDNCHVPWGITHEKMMQIVESRPHVSGQFVWTGFDYIGEPTPFKWPAHSSYFGIVDLAGFPKDVFYLYQSRWRPDINVLHLFPHWNWEPGQEIDMWAYYNNADEVELFVNGESQGVCRADDGKLHAEWRVTYQPGRAEAVSRRNGKEVARHAVVTAGKPAAIRLTPDRNLITADGVDLSYVTVEILDADGNLCPWADNDVSFELSGNAFIAGVDNGSPISLESFKADHRKAFYGKALVILQNDGRAGKATVTARSAGLTPDTVEITAE